MTIKILIRIITTATTNADYKKHNEKLHIYGNDYFHHKYCKSYKKSFEGMEIY